MNFGGFHAGGYGGGYAVHVNVGRENGSEPRGTVGSGFELNRVRLVLPAGNGDAG